jgi:hypothetical protein
LGNPFRALGEAWRATSFLIVRKRALATTDLDLAFAETVHEDMLVGLLLLEVLVGVLDELVDALVFPLTMLVDHLAFSVVDVLANRLDFLLVLLAMAIFEKVRLEVSVLKHLKGLVFLETGSRG